MTKTSSSILSNITLKERIIEELAEELNINKAFLKEHSKLLMTYAEIKLELIMYTSIIPFNELEHYKELQALERKFFIHLNELLNKK